MSVISKPILNAVGWYFEQLFNNPIKTKAVTRSVDKSQVILKNAEIKYFSAHFQLCYRILCQLCVPKDVLNG